MSKEMVILDAFLESKMEIVSEFEYENVFMAIWENLNEEGVAEEILNSNLSMMSIFLIEASDGYDVSKYGFGYGYGYGDGYGYGYGDGYGYGYGYGDGYGYGYGYGLNYYFQNGNYVLRK